MLDEGTEVSPKMEKKMHFNHKTYNWNTHNIPYLPADRPHPRIGRTPNFQWFSWGKKIVEVEYPVVVCVVS